jgi:hypothetical protein
LRLNSEQLAVNGVLDLKADTSAAVVGFNLHFKTVARAEIMGLFKLLWPA